MRFVVEYRAYYEFIEESIDCLKVFEADSLEDALLYSQAQWSYNKVYELDEWFKLNKKDVSKEIAKLKQKASPAKGIWWYVVDGAEVSSLIKGVKLPEQLKPVMHYHMTVMFDVTYEELPNWLICEHNEGRIPEGDWYKELSVRGIAFNEKGAALSMGIWSTNNYSHITVALAEGVPPVYSNTLLSGEDGPYQYLPLDSNLKGHLEFHPFEG